jgi:GNAT superfamily N-acetyltransferase
MIIRDAGPGDAGAWRGLWDQYLAFYAEVLAPQITDATWARLMDPTSPVKARLAVDPSLGADGGRVIGFAIHMHHPSTWVATEDCYLEDLFVSEDARGLGAGRALIDDLIALARTKGWSRLYWHTNEGNARARALYDSYVQSDGHIRYRLPLGGPGH